MNFKETTTVIPVAVVPIAECVAQAQSFATTESKIIQANKLIVVLCPRIIEGINSIFTEVCKCGEREYHSNYVVIFQRSLTKIKTWDNEIIERERNRIRQHRYFANTEHSITGDFIHQVYINVARKVYNNVYVYEIGVSPMQKQQNKRSLEIIVRESIHDTIYENM